MSLCVESLKYPKPPRHPHRQEREPGKGADSWGRCSLLSARSSRLPQGSSRSTVRLSTLERKRAHPCALSAPYGNPMTL